jgi:hypothetical protein
MDLNFNKTEAEVAKSIGMSLQGLKKMRIAGVVPKTVYRKFGYRTLRYSQLLFDKWAKSI